VGPEGEGAEDR